MKIARLIGMVCIWISFSIYAADPEYQPLLWVDLLPLEDYQALYNPPEIVHTSPEQDDQPLLGSSSGSFENAGSAFEKALVSAKVVPEWNEQMISLPGYVVPLEHNEDGKVTEFFLVPYFGACIHVPPPPPNQIVFVSYPAGLEQASIYEAYTVQGKLLTTSTTNQTATSAYSIVADAISLYEVDEGAE